MTESQKQNLDNPPISVSVIGKYRKGFNIICGLILICLFLYFVVGEFLGWHIAFTKYGALKIRSEFANLVSIREEHFWYGTKYKEVIDWHSRKEIYQIKNNLRHGKYYIDDGSVEGQYTNDKKDGIWVFRNEDGSKTKEETYDNGNLIKTINYKDGKPVEETND